MYRQIQSHLIKSLQTWRCVALLGPRQVGKSYLLKQILQASPGTYLSFDDPLVREEVAKDPVAYLKRYYQPGKYLFIDEAAKVPEIFSAVKILVDHYDPNPTGICLANSGNYLLLNRIKESLAGRVHLLPIYPFSWQELEGKKAMPGLITLMEEGEIPNRLVGGSLVEIERSREERLLWGGYPAPSFATDTESKIQWGNDYLHTYILPLVMEQFGIREVSSFERAARMLFSQNGKSLNANKVATIIGASQPTITSYAHQLIAMMVIDLLNLFVRNPIKRLAKQPKLYVNDTLLLHISLGSRFSLQAAQENSLIGSIYEAFIFNEIKKTIANNGLTAEYFTWRTQDKAEVDVVLQTNSGILPFEIKWAKKISRRDTTGLHSFLEDSPDIKRGYIIYPGEKILSISEKVVAIPDWWLFGILGEDITGIAAYK
ncbi:MAG: hypothetical protein A2W61_05210 [Deltaproteobacteria bacterium RIFCSPLOWO2_01_44_7]|nr:MAG: hypothetical protein A2712_01720 [Deltaproteobacteria bacterium RIFCSPHIGHO2_01_FULL_43_49]OGQ15154.1 MAG: hypothetical protein A3D22_03755 [Deltaproteobacteria bacterium RIFCSPHIGHO2_02_FULL_44_53]OGQ27225.1 MAG: hypothetical protein A3D98_02315 [Deltaproteobacteria bacterium RIFCSPHIGHO2_12_FULL_44_21]OGQ31671.1 MAG: hypothetical protein A2979_04915 [Deltaproteobacteria bacterium RIFCSPLOWO2_01_FULL_45_74]OGQ38811.1 MAG: hypothetical protein A2W61_05210 [Deltaproteobacteria bacterium 